MPRQTDRQTYVHMCNLCKSYRGISPRMPFVFTKSWGSNVYELSKRFIDKSILEIGWLVKLELRPRLCIINEQFSVQNADFHLNQWKIFFSVWHRLTWIEWNRIDFLKTFFLNPHLLIIRKIYNIEKKNENAWFSAACSAWFLCMNEYRHMYVFIRVCVALFLSLSLSI